MIRPDLSRWKNFENTKGLFLFAQAIEELMFHHTIDTFKAPALNTRFRVLELLSLAVEYSKGKIKADVLSHVIEELKWSVNQDPVIIPEYTDLVNTYLGGINECKDKPAELIAVTKSLSIYLNNILWNELKSKLLQAVNDNNHEKILSLAAAFSVDIEARGYSRSYLYFMNKEYFINKNDEYPVITNDAICDFFSVYEQKEQVWKVVLRGGTGYSTLVDHAKHFNIEIAEKAPDVPIKGFRERRFFGESSKYPYFIIHNEIRAKDPFSARMLGSKVLEVLCAAFSFYDHITKFETSDYFLILNTETKETYILKSEINPMMFRSKTNHKETKNSIDLTMQLVFGGKLTRQSRYNGVKALNYHRSALDANNEENQLLNLWAAIEGILPPPDEKKARIVHYVEHLIPSLTLTYTNRIFKYMRDCLYNYTQEVSDHVRAITPTDNELYNIAYLLCCEEATEDRNDMYRLMGKNPLLKYRCEEIHKRFSSADATITTIKNHKRKIEWHIQRIYTTRNAIMHTAQSTPYIRTLIENLHTYFDILIQSLSIVASNTSTEVDIRTMLKTICITEREYMKRLDTLRCNCNKDNFCEVIFCHPNPVACTVVPK